MPHESQNTYLTGQEQLGNSVLGQSDDGITKIYRFGEPSPLGASQNVPLSETAQSQVDWQDFPLTQTSRSRADGRPFVPTSVSLRPPVGVARRGHGCILQTRQLWEGTVKEVRQQGFVATLSDRTNTRNPDEQTMFYFGEVSAEDRQLVRPGSAFYWIIGTETTIGGQLKNVSYIQFRRLPVWTSRALKRAAERARRVRQLFRASE
jgi:hypothetical protein